VRTPFNSSGRVIAIRVLSGLAPAVVVALFVLASRLPGRLPDGEIVQITRGGAFEGEPSLSPDGQWLAYRCDVRGTGDICLSAADGGNVRNLTADSTDDESDPAFSPDGTTIAFRSARAGIGLVSRSGGPIRALTASGSNPAWTPDGEAILYTVEMPSGRDFRPGVSEGWKIEIATGVANRIAPGDFREPAVSPGNQRIAYVGRPVDSRNRPRLSSTHADLWTVAVDGAPPVRVTDDAAMESSPLWSPDGRFLYYISNRNGSSGIWRIRINERTGRTRGHPERVRTPPSQPVHLTRSADGRRFAWSDARPVQRVLRIVFDADARRTRGAAVEVTTGDAESESAGEEIDLNKLRPAARPGDDGEPIVPPGTAFPGHWSPDLRRFAGTAGGSVWIYTRETQRYQQFRQGAHPVWLRDSRRLIYAYSGRLYIADAVLGISRELFGMPDQHLDAPTLSRDNLHLYFTHAGTDANLWVMNVRGY
jgi:Tol biopolymer transport system component